MRPLLPNAPLNPEAPVRPDVPTRRMAAFKSLNLHRGHLRSTSIPSGAVMFGKRHASSTAKHLQGAKLDKCD